MISGWNVNCLSEKDTKNRSRSECTGRFSSWPVQPMFGRVPAAEILLPSLEFDWAADLVIISDWNMNYLNGIDAGNTPRSRCTGSFSSWPGRLVSGRYPASCKIAS